MSKNEIIITKLKALARRMFPDGSGEVYLYGSRANGSANSGSDWDLLVLIDDSRSTSDNFANFAMPFAEIGWQYGEQITPLHYTRSQWLAEKATAFFRNVTANCIRL